MTSLANAGGRHIVTSFGSGRLVLEHSVQLASRIRPTVLPRSASQPHDRYTILLRSVVSPINVHSSEIGWPAP